MNLLPSPRGLRPLAALLLLLLLLPTGSPAQWQEQTGLAELRALAGTTNVDGLGVLVTQVEAFSGDNYLPEFGTNPIAGTGNFASKTFTDLTELDSDTGASPHARAVGDFWYGNASHVSTAPGISEIRAQLADDYHGAGFLKPGNGGPLVEPASVQNHSWIGDGSNDLLRRFDFAVGRDGFVACVGLNNGSQTVVPDLLASAYNAISVGLTDGNHSRGGTPGDLDGPGRTKPELVVPTDRTSWATAIMSGFASILIQVANGAPALSPATRPEVVKALLMGGATKSALPGWSHSPSQPLDPVFGAGQANILNAYRILLAGQQPPGPPTTPVAPLGWDLRTSDPTTPLSYTLEIPPGHYARDFSLVATWHRTITDSQGGPRFVPEANLADINLDLFEADAAASGSPIATSTSTIDNVEHIYRASLPAGTYTFRVTASESIDFAAAWFSTLIELAEIPLEIVAWSWDATTNLVSLQWTAMAGRIYDVESSTDLAVWLPVSGFTSIEPTVDSPTLTATFLAPPAADGRQFFRVADVTP
ncbi:hypothetical protein BH23VER1_BH23VER1_13740 [soil metagenome]